MKKITLILIFACISGFVNAQSELTVFEEWTTGKGS